MRALAPALLASLLLAGCQAGEAVDVAVLRSGLAVARPEAPATAFRSRADVERYLVGRDVDAGLRASLADLTDFSKQYILAARGVASGAPRLTLLGARKAAGVVTIRLGTVDAGAPTMMPGLAYMLLAVPDPGAAVSVTID